MNIKKMLINIFLLLLTAYLAFGSLLFFRQKSIIYYPDKQNFEDCPGFFDYQKINYQGTRFYFKEGSADLIVHYHGNAGSACDRSYFRSFFEKSGKSLMFVEYAGYSNDKHSPAKKLLLQDATNIASYIEEQSFASVTIYGESLGAAIAVYHSSIGRVDNLALVTPFARLEEVAKFFYSFYPVSLILTEKYDNIKYLENFAGQVLILHGSDDTVILPRFSQQLFEAVKSENKEYVLIEDRGHNDIWNSDLFRQKLGEFISEIKN